MRIFKNLGLFPRNDNSCDTAWTWFFENVRREAITVEKGSQVIGRRTLSSLTRRTVEPFDPSDNCAAADKHTIRNNDEMTLRLQYTVHFSQSLRREDELGRKGTNDSGERFGCIGQRLRLPTRQPRG